MSVRQLWTLAGAWSAGLLCAPHLPETVAPALLVLTALALIGFRFINGRRLLVAALFASALIAGRAADIRISWGPWGDSRPAHHGLSNPGYRPLLTASRLEPADDEDTEPLEVLARQRPAWASEPVWGLIQGVLFNRRRALDAEWAAAFRGTGAAHILAISGLHVGIILAALVLLARLVCRRRSLSLSLSLPLLWVYIVLIGCPPSAVRAGCMATLAVAVMLARVRTEPERILPVAALAILLVNPRLLASVGFQLSVAAVAGIVAILGPRPSGQSTRRSPLQAGCNLLLLTLAAQSAVLPLQILVFGTFSPFAPLVNVVAVPLLGIWLPTALAAVLATALGLPAAMLAGALCEGLGRLMFWWIALWNSLPAAQLPLPVWAALPALLIVPCWRRGGRAGLMALLAALAVVWSPLSARSAPRIAFLDVGQGDAIVIESVRPRRVAVIDAGPRYPGWDAGQAVVAPYLRSRGIERIDLLIATHTDADHIGGMPALARRFPIGALVRGEWADPAPPSAEWLRLALLDAGVPDIPVASGDRLRLGRRVTLDVLAGADPSTVPSSANDRSLVLRALLGTERVLLTGDLEQDGEGRLRPMWAHLRCEVLKVPHHGSADALSPALLAAASPELAVISVGARNRHGHPDPATLARLTVAGATLRRTDRQGAYVHVARR